MCASRLEPFFVTQRWPQSSQIRNGRHAELVGRKYCGQTLAGYLPQCRSNRINQHAGLLHFLTAEIIWLIVPIPGYPCVIAQIATLSVDYAPTAVIGCPHMDPDSYSASLHASGEGAAVAATMSNSGCGAPHGHPPTLRNFHILETSR
jgi:hypothetical protein